MATMPHESLKKTVGPIYDSALGFVNTVWQFPEAQLFSHIYLVLAAVPILIFLLSIVFISFGLVSFLLFILIGVEVFVVVLSLCILVPVLIICFWVAVVAFLAIFIGIKVLHLAAEFSGPVKTPSTISKATKEQ
ncbi:hypothetical protein K450DRAFT_107607 [Umbelopsis ramanniana AG]|uniref:Uncharacterized protein n=1 Tax=Umbelopsis ramanniana AG TaxID=1314678 RepID=A0AAD5E6B5_UMBRA|nr:uncharacterized protein K450DRAFT_107607 [Umbelopsis ramanniana AG]KAI8577145.1 hypothetical protein K450DRAFT_107607 [Umbelopsis ramanniana AG]